VTRELRTALAVARLQPCVVCGVGDGNVAAFAPNDPVAWGAPHGTQRVLVYALCGRCEASTTPEQREDVLRHRRAA
jgi:hypothetical protein